MQSPSHYGIYYGYIVLCVVSGERIVQGFIYECYSLFMIVFRIILVFCISLLFGCIQGSPIPRQGWKMMLY